MRRQRPSVQQQQGYSNNTIVFISIMPCTKSLDIDTTKKVVVTGATGYIAGALIRQLLEAGVTVHATVRDASQQDRLQYLVDLANDSKGSIHFFSADLTQPGSFTEAMRGTCIVFHTASPFLMQAADAHKDLIRVAVQGTENVLQQATQTPTVERVVLTSSCAAVNADAADTVNAPGGVLTESVWNRTSTITNGPYSLSKTLAEQRAWEIAGSQTQWKLVVLNPSFVLGPGIKTHKTATSFQIMQSLTSHAAVPNLALGVVDVRDVAEAHMAAAYLPDAAGRHILCGTNSTAAAVGMALQEKYGAQYAVPTRRLPLNRFFAWLLAPLMGFTRRTMARNLDVKLNYDCTKAKQALGMEFRPMKRTVEDMVCGT